MTRIKETLLAGLFGLGACTQLPPFQQQPADPKVEAAIIQACAQSGLFKLVNGTVATFVPAANLPVALVDAGIDQVCANPAKFAGDAATVQWLIKNLNAARAGG